ncbi:GGDEF domain-containing protein [Vibrio sinaloensis]|uniref:GGDEF domain-containing protein n=1 Tax=Photobacterium sp. (strain ATCC 43367) TaxID=379097 RepID=UPI00057DF58F|nr:GGDEF domain-containing protein [Vibrio sinaloensis]KHT38745.1 diguanylate cyclase [Vibrio sinaloensis]
MELDIFHPSRHLRRAVLFWLSLMLACMSAIFSIFNFLGGAEPIQIWPLATFSLISLFVSYNTYQHSSGAPLTVSYVFTLISLVTYATFVYPLSYGLFTWACLFPVLFYLILGRRKGTLATGAGFLTVLMTVSYKIIECSFVDSAHLAINFALTFCCIWLTSHILEVKRKTSEASLGQLASRDSLTGVYNRHALVHNFNRYHNESAKVPLSLLILDLDYFKQVNDQYGHDVGDKVLVETAALLDALCDEHLVYRIGGEEFCIALHNSNLQHAKYKAELIRQAIEQYSFSGAEAPIKLTVSIGVYECHHFDSLESVLKEADKELYKAKKNGRNQVMVSQEAVTSASS